MIITICFSALLSLIFGCRALLACGEPEPHCFFPSSPVIGVLAQPHNKNRREWAAAPVAAALLPRNATSIYGSNMDNASETQYIAASYIKWLEAGGARSIPIPYDAVDHALLDDLFDQMHALLLPGGASELPYAVEYLLDKIVASNRDGFYFPVWGTCLGFEFLIAHFGGSEALQSGFVAENVSLPLQRVVPRYLYRDPTIYFTVTQENVTMNNHEQGIEPKYFVQNKMLSSLWKITSVNRDDRHRPFVSTIEPKDPDSFPIYGVQYHPEKNAFEYATYPHTNIPYEDIDHSPAAVEFSFYMARFLVDLARRTIQEQQKRGGKNSAVSWHEYTQTDRFPTVVTYPQQVGIKFEQVYILPSAKHWLNNSNGESDESNRLSTTV